MLEIKKLRMESPRDTGATIYDSPDYFLKYIDMYFNDTFDLIKFNFTHFFVPTLLFPTRSEIHPYLDIFYNK